MDNVIAVSQGVEGEGGVNSRRETVVDESTGKGKGIADGSNVLLLIVDTCLGYQHRKLLLLLWTSFLAPWLVGTPSFRSFSIGNSSSVVGVTSLLI